MTLIETLIEKAKANPKKIALPECEAENTLLAARRVLDSGIGFPVLVNDPAVIKETAEKAGVSLEGMTIVDITDEAARDELIARYMSYPRLMLSEKGCKRKMKNPIYYAMIMEAAGDVDATFCGHTNTTGDVLLTAQQTIGIKMAWEAGAGKVQPIMELMYQLPDNMNHFILDGAFRQPCLWVNKMGERFMPEDQIANTTFTGNAIAAQPGKVGYAIMDSKLLKKYKKKGPDIVSHVHPHDLYDHFDEQWERDLADGYEPIAQADTIEELAEKMGIDVEGLVAQVEEYNEMCEQGYDEIFEKDRAYMQPIEKAPFYICRQNVGAYGSLGGVKVNHKLQVMTQDSKVIPGLYCAGTDACNIFGDSYPFILSGNTMGFCLNSGRIAGENASASDEDYEDFDF